MQTSQTMDPPLLQTPPPLDPAWLQLEEEANLRGPRPAISPLARQPVYAQECRILNAAMMAEGQPDHHLSQGIRTRAFTVPSTADGFAIPMLQYELADAAADNKRGQSEEKDADEDDNDSSGKARVVVLYIHGGGLLVGEADSEDFSCRRILKSDALAGTRPTLYSVGYRLKPQHTAAQAVSDCASALEHAARAHRAGGGARILLVGSSSGGELAALVSQSAAGSRARLHGVLLRAPVTTDAPGGADFVPARFRVLHTSAVPAFETSLAGLIRRAEPRDGLPRMPLECGTAELRALSLPRTWIQVCTNDTLYSDGVCYARALREAGVDVRVDVVWGWPHTFWLKFPHLKRAREADEAMLEGLAWLVE